MTEPRYPNDPRDYVDDRCRYCDADEIRSEAEEQGFDSEDFLDEFGLCYTCHKEEQYDLSRSER